MHHAQQEPQKKALTNPRDGCPRPLERATYGGNVFIGLSILPPPMIRTVLAADSYCRVSGTQEVGGKQSLSEGRDWERETS